MNVEVHSRGLPVLFLASIVAVCSCGDAGSRSVARRKFQQAPERTLAVASPRGVPVTAGWGGLDGNGDLLLGGPLHNYWLGQPVKHISGFDLYRELDLLESGTPTGAPWRAWPSETYIAKAGCYAWQVDGLGFIEIITIQAYGWPAPTRLRTAAVYLVVDAVTLPSSITSRVAPSGTAASSFPPTGKGRRHPWNQQGR